jgi:hypothetical protein
MNAAGPVFSGSFEVGGLVSLLKGRQKRRIPDQRDTEKR